MTDMTDKEIVEATKWELEIVLRNQKELRSIGRDIEWREGERLKELRTRLDAALGIKPKEKEDVEPSALDLALAVYKKEEK